MKKILSCLSLLIFLANPVFAAVGINVNGTTIGTAGNLYVACNTGGTPFIDGFNYSATCSNTLVADGTYNGGYVSLGTIDSGIALTNALIKKTIQSTAGGTASDTLGAGTPNQILTIEIVGTVTGSWTLTAASGVLTTGWTSIIFNTTTEFVTLLYLNSTQGWIILSNGASAGNTPATIVDASGT